jgi:kynureninase
LLGVPADVHPELTARRADYPILAGSVYLANHTLGAMHRDTPGRLVEYAALWASAGVTAWDTWQPEMTRVADLVGAIVGAPAGTTVLRANVAELLGTVLSCLDFGGRRNRIVYADEVEWPGSHYLLREQVRYGADVVTVPISEDGGITLDEQRLVDAIDGRTALVYLSAVLFRTATVTEIAPVVAKAHDAGAIVVLDAYQAAGTLPLDVVELGVDVCVGGSVKYLCGGPGAGWMYVAPAIVDVLRPSAVGWFGHARPFDFAFADVEYAPGVVRFAGGTPNVPAAYAAAPGYQAVLDVGVQRIRERSQSLTQRLVAAVIGHGWTVNSPLQAERRGGHVAFDPGNARRVHDRLVERGVVLDHRPGVGLRAAPHFYNTADEVDALVEHVAEIVAAL